VRFPAFERVALGRRSLLAAALIVLVSGAASWLRLPADALPDLSNPRVVVLGRWSGHDATEVARALTEPLSAALSAVHDLTSVRATTMPGMTFLEAEFPSERLADERRVEIQSALGGVERRLPLGAAIEVGPSAPSTGWVFEYVLTDRRRQHDPLELRRLEIEVLRPTLARVPGVAEVATMGGGEPELVVDADLEALRGRGLALSDVSSAVGASVRAGASSVQALAQTKVGGGSAPSPILSEVATVRLASGRSQAVLDLDGAVDGIGGVVVVGRGADPRAVIRGVKTALGAVSGRLPSDVQVVTVYDRSPLIARIEATFLRAVVEEIALVVLVVLLLMAHGASALVPLAALVLTVTLTATGLGALGTQANVMSLGGIAIALGLAVDAEIVVVDACHRALAERDPVTPSSVVVRRATAKVAPAIVTALLIAALAFLPVFAFGGETGRMLRPLAVGKTVVVLAALVVTLMAGPALRERAFAGGLRSARRSRLMEAATRAYEPLVRWALERPGLTLATAALALLSAVPLTRSLGGEFLPSVDEGDLLYMPSTTAVLPHDEERAELQHHDQRLLANRTVGSVFGKLGRVETATDPAPMSMIESIVHLRPPSERPLVPRRRWYTGWAPRPLSVLLRLAWPEEVPPTDGELVDDLDRALRMPGWRAAWTMPIRARLDMTSTGVRTPVAARIVATDPARLDDLARRVRDALVGLRGTRAVVYEGLRGQPILRFQPDESALARLGVSRAAALAVADLVLTDDPVALARGGAATIPVRVRPALDHARSEEKLARLTVRGTAAGGQPVPLSFLGGAQWADVPAVLHADAGRTVAYVYVDLEGGVDVESYVKQAEVAVARVRRLRPGEAIEWTGAHELLAKGRRRLSLVVPLVLIFIVALLYAQLRRLAEVAIIVAAVPLSLVGSLWALAALGYSMSPPVWVGLLSVVGLSTQTAIVMGVYLDQAFYRRLREGRIVTPADVVSAHMEGTLLRLRPKLMTIATMTGGLLPLLWSRGAGAEVMKRVAAPMLGGLVTSAFLTLEILPVLYTLWRQGQLRRAQRTCHSLVDVVGRPPSWA
jgi:copper/silver efflux system protein